MATQWAALCEDPWFRDAPYKVETTASGDILMSPASNRHGKIQFRLAARLVAALPAGEVQVEAAIATSAGVRVADIVWMSRTFTKAHGDETPFPRAPEICVEVLSPTNRGAEITGKIALYLARGASEVWICREDGAMAFHGATGVLERSSLCPSFPVRI